MFKNKLDMIRGRVYTTFGFDHRLPFFWKKLKLGPLIGSKIHLWAEGVP